MMDQLGIKALRPGPSGDEKAPNHANYDESMANPYPNLPDVLTLNEWQEGDDGGDVVEASGGRRSWRTMREYVYGRVPENCPKVTWTVTVTDHEMVGWMPVIAKDLIGHVDNSAYPVIDVNISHDAGDAGECEGTGAGADDVWPRRLPAPTRAVGGRSGQRSTQRVKALLVQQDPSLKDVFEQLSGLAAGEGDAVPVFRR